MKHIGKIIDLPKIADPRGNLTVAESMKNVPFDIKRVYWVYDVPGGECRGGHAHKKLKQMVRKLRLFGNRCFIPHHHCSNPKTLLESLV